MSQWHEWPVITLSEQLINYWVMKLVFTLLGFSNLSLCLTRRGNDFDEEEILQEKKKQETYLLFHPLSVYTVTRWLKSKLGWKIFKLYISTPPLHTNHPGERIARRSGAEEEVVHQTVNSLTQRTAEALCQTVASDRFMSACYPCKQVKRSFTLLIIS